MPETPRDPETIARVKADATARLLAIPNVILVGIGPKVVGGQATGEPAIRVFVRRKLPADEVPPDELIPPVIDGVLTDVDTAGDPVPVADPPPVDRPGAIGVLDARQNPPPATTRLRPDRGTYRSPGLVGGVEINTVGSRRGGTLGCLMWDPNNHDIGFGLTNMHVIHAPDVRTVTKNVTKVGQPEGIELSKKCCNDVIGTWAGGGKTDRRDEALVRLSPGMKWQAKIADIGLVAGKHTLDQTEVTGTQKYKVAKRGRTTGVTGGTIAALDATGTEVDNLIVIDPVDNPGKGPGEVVFFLIEGDSGSALVNSANEVVGLVWGRDDTGKGYAYHIDRVLARLQNDGVTVEVARSTDPNEVHTVPGGTFAAVPQEVAELVAADPAERLAFTGTGGRVPLGQPWFSDVPPAAATVTRVLDDLAASESGRLLLDLWRAHREEVMHLIDNDRRVKLAWHRGGGAALMQLLLRLPADPGRTLPETLYGQPLMSSVDRVHAALARGGSARLRADLERARAVLPDLGGRSYAQLVAALGAKELVPGG
jgi:hypothetical protein